MEIIGYIFTLTLCSVLQDTVSELMLHARDVVCLFLQSPKDDGITNTVYQQHLNSMLL